jgi:glycosyltransferase involved in cell wall biosynthesis
LNQAKAGAYSLIDDSKELVQKIVALLDSPTMAQELGRNGRRYFREHFNKSSGALILLRGQENVDYWGRLKALWVVNELKIFVFLHALRGEF